MVCQFSSWVVTLVFLERAKIIHPFSHLMKVRPSYSPFVLPSCTVEVFEVTNSKKIHVPDSLQAERSCQLCFGSFIASNNRLKFIGENNECLNKQRCDKQYPSDPNHHCEMIFLSNLQTWRRKSVRPLLQPTTHSVCFERQSNVLTHFGDRTDMHS